MASANFNFFDNWFPKPPKPPKPINLLLPIDSFSPKSTTPSNFAAINFSNPFKRSEPKKPQHDPEELALRRELLEQYFWECEEQPDFRHTPKVDKILAEKDSILEVKENPTEEEIKENEKWWAELRASPVFQFLKRSEEIATTMNEMELKKNLLPWRSEDWRWWVDVPNVTGLDGRPMPRRALLTEEDRQEKFWDFARQFFLGLWGFRQRPYPPGRPIDVSQAIGYERLEKRYYDFIMRSTGRGGFYYKDRLGRTRGPMELIQLKTAWGGGIIDKDTFLWQDDMDEWVPIHMIYGMERAIATWEVRLGAAATAFLHKLQKGIPPWVPLKGRERKTYKQLQQEAIESKRRDLAVLEANDGIWPGLKIPSHALFLWASGPELTTTLEAERIEHMPNKYIPKDVRLQLAKIIPGLRPWEVLSVEQAMDQITYGGKWYREPLGTYTVGPPYLQEWNNYVMMLAEVVYDSLKMVRRRMTKFPGLEQMIALAKDENKSRRDKLRLLKQCLQKWRIIFESKRD